MSLFLLDYIAIVVVYSYSTQFDLELNWGAVNSIVILKKTRGVLESPQPDSNFAHGSEPWKSKGSGP